MQGLIALLVIQNKYNLLINVSNIFCVRIHN